MEKITKIGSKIQSELELCKQTHWRLGVMSKLTWLQQQQSSSPAQLTVTSLIGQNFAIFSFSARQHTVMYSQATCFWLLKKRTRGNSALSLQDSLDDVWMVRKWRSVEMRGVTAQAIQPNTQPIHLWMIRANRLYCLI